MEKRNQQLQVPPLSLSLSSVFVFISFFFVLLVYRCPFIVTFAAPIYALPNIRNIFFLRACVWRMFALSLTPYTPRKGEPNPADGALSLPHFPFASPFFPLRPRLLCLTLSFSPSFFCQDARIPAAWGEGVDKDAEIRFSVATPQRVPIGFLGAGDPGRAQPPHPIHGTTAGRRNKYR